MNKKCRFPKCKEPATDGHHVTYKPSWIVPLCRQHHQDITVINTNHAFRLGRKLTPYRRRLIWTKWLKGELKPIMTPEAEKWISKWRKPKVAVDWSYRAECMTEEIFNTGLTIGEAKIITANAWRYLLERSIDPEGLDICLMSDSNRSVGGGFGADIAEKNLREAWPFWWLPEVRGPFMNMDEGRGDL